MLLFIQVQPNVIHSSNLIQTVTPQMLLVCCWRTMKEISLFFGDLVKNLPLENETSKLNILTSVQVNRIGEYFVKHLLYFSVAIRLYKSLGK